MGNKIRILIIEDDQEKRSEFKFAIQLHPRLELCGETGSEKEGLMLLSGGKTDVVILDLELTEGNGIRLAEQMRNMPIRQPFVVVTTNNASSSVLQYLRTEIQVDFVFQKTNISYTAEQVLDIIEKVYKYHNEPNPRSANEKEILKDRICQELHQMGFAPNYAGTDYLMDIFLFISDHPHDPIQISKVIYPMIAKKYHSDPANVERAIRTSIERVWNNTSLMTLTKYYPYNVENKNGRPSNGEFIHNMKLKFFGK